MNPQVNVLVTSRETIKPSSPTPHTLKCFKLSLLDQLSPPAYVPMIIYYAPNCHPDEAKSRERIDVLKKSLSRTLTQFYPLAGRIEGNLFADCNDQGVDFFEAKVNRPLSDILRLPGVDVLNQFLPQEYKAAIASPKFQVAIQVNTFSCGGMAIGTSISHKLVDGITFTSFMNIWASIARGAEEYSPPVFVGHHFFPPKDLSGLFQVLDIPKAKNITKRFVFKLSKIDSLRERVFGSSRVNEHSRVEIVSALIWKCAVEASSTARSLSGSDRSPSFLTQTVNLRARMNPPLPDSAAGNLLWLAMAQSPSDCRGKLELKELVYQVQNSLKKFDNEYVKKMQGEDGLLVLGETLDKIGELVSKEVDVYRFTSLRKFQLYGSDFGWGKPVWVSSAGLEFKNVVVLIETRDGDKIEAWITLEEQEMAIFERDQELLSFDSTNLHLNSRF